MRVYTAVHVLLYIFAAVFKVFKVFFHNLHILQMKYIKTLLVLHKMQILSRKATKCLNVPACYQIGQNEALKPKHICGSKKGLNVEIMQMSNVIFNGL